MAKEPRFYRRLSRPVAGLSSYSSLWQGPDHLLLVKSSGYTEEYRRFQYADIQAILACESDRRLAWNIVWVVLAVITACFLILGLIEHQKPLASGIFMAVVSVLFALNHFRGPTCRVVLITRVQTVRLPLVRRQKVEQVLRVVQPLIDAAQADLVSTSGMISPPHVPPA